MPNDEKGGRGGLLPDVPGAPGSGDQAGGDAATAVSDAVQHLLDTLAETAPAAAPTQSKVRPDAIVIIEDDGDIRHILQRVLQAAGYQVMVFPSAIEALGQINVEQTALIITDLAMPGMGGDMFIRRFKKSPQTSHIPIIAVTAFSDDTVGYRAKVAGCDDFIRKPFRSKQILEAVEKHLKQASASKA